MAISYNGYRAGAVEGDEKFTASRDGYTFYRYYKPSGTVLWTGHAAFDSSPVARIASRFQRTPIQVTVPFAKVRGIKLTFGVGLITKGYAIGDVYVYSSGEGVSTDVGADGATISYPTSATVNRASLLSTTGTKIVSKSQITSSASFATNYDLNLATDGVSKLVIGIANNSTLTNFASDAVVGKFDSWNRPGNWYHMYLTLNKIEAI